MIAQTIAQLCGWCEEIAQRKPVSQQTHSEAEDAIAVYLHSVWTKTDTYPLDQHLLRTVRSGLAVLGAPKNVIRLHASHIASRLRRMR